MEGVLNKSWDEITSDKRTFVAFQTKMIAKNGLDSVPKVKCRCLKMVSILFAVKCYYCDEWFCPTCAGVHFGKTKEEYLNGGEK
jgi:hypothetical protein